MIDVKINLNIELQGRTMMSKEECLKTIHKEITIKHGKLAGKKRFKSVLVDDWDKMDVHSIMVKGDKKGDKPERLSFATRKYIPARQTINISREAYEDMIAKDSCPEWAKMPIWKKMNNHQRIAAHMEKIAESLGGKVIDFFVFED